jgi:hypothetical protein
MRNPSLSCIVRTMDRVRPIFNVNNAMKLTCYFLCLPQLHI